MLQNLKNLRIAQKLWLASAIMALPTLLMVWWMDARTGLIATAHNETNGIEYLRVARLALEHIGQHAAASAAVASGDKSLRNTQASLQDAVQSDFAALDSVDQKYGQEYGTRPAVTALKRAWLDLKEKSDRLSARESLDAHTAVLGSVAELMRTVGDKSELILDPQIDTYYLMATMLIDVPQAVSTVAQIRTLGAGGLAGGAELANRKVDLISLSSRIAGLNSGIRRNSQVLFNGDAERERNLGPQVNAALAAGSDFAMYLQDEIIAPAQPKVSSRQFYDRATTAATEYLKLFDASSAVLEQGLNTRGSAFRRDQLSNSGVALGLVFIAGLLAVLLSRGITRQVDAIMLLFRQIGMGDFKARAEVTATDELGEMAESLNSVLDATVGLIQSREERDRIQESIQKLLSEISVVAEGDLTAQAEVTAEMTGAIADSINFMIAELRRIISHVQATTLTVSASASAVQTTAESLASGSETQSTQIVEASAAIGDIAQSIEQVSSSASTAATIAERASQSAKDGADSVRRTIDGMSGIRQQVQQTAKRIKRLGESSQEIGEIVQLISDISDRTSILALNASIQAAMAGEAGKGFAVVAEEVERLAERSTEATKKIGGLIKSIQSDTNEAIAAMEETTREVVGGSAVANEAGQRLTEIESVSGQLADLIQSISKAAKQQTRGSESIAKSMGEISGVTQQTASGAKQAAVSIKKLAELADGLRGDLTRFKLPKAAA